MRITTAASITGGGGGGGGGGDLLRGDNPAADLRGELALGLPAEELARLRLRLRRNGCCVGPPASLGDRPSMSVWPVLARTDRADAGRDDDRERIVDRRAAEAEVEAGDGGMGVRECWRLPVRTTELWVVVGSERGVAEATEFVKGVRGASSSRSNGLSGLMTSRPLLAAAAWAAAVMGMEEGLGSMRLVMYRLGCRRPMTSGDE